MQTNIRKALIILLTLFSLLGIWQPLGQYLVIPVSIQINAVWMELFFAEHNLEIIYQQQAQMWHIKSGLFSAQYPYPEGLIKPDLNVKETILPLGNMAPFSLAIPIYLFLFICLLMLNNTNNKLLLQASFKHLSLILLSITLTMGVHLLVTYTNLTAADLPNLRTITPTGSIAIPFTPKPLQLDLLNAVRDALLFFSILILPVGLLPKRSSTP